MLRKFTKRNCRGFSCCYMCASKEIFNKDFNISLYTDEKYGLPICLQCIYKKMKDIKEDYIIDII